MEDYGKVRVQQSEKCHGCGSLYNLYLNFIRGKKKKRSKQMVSKKHYFHTKIIKKFIITSNADSQSSDQDFLRIN